MSDLEASAQAFTDHSPAEPGDRIASSGTNAERLIAFSDATELLDELGQTDLDNVDGSLHRAIEGLAKLADAVEPSLSSVDDDPELAESVAFVIESSALVRHAALGQTDDDVDTQQFETLCEEIELRLSAQGDLDAAVGAWDDVQPETPSASAEVVAPSEDEIAALLSSLSSQTQAASGQAAEPKPQDQASPFTAQADLEFNGTGEDHDTPPAPTRDVFAAKVGNSDIPIPQADDVNVDGELREAFMDDATRGLESMEQALLDLESTPGDAGPVTTIGRELHTIKGASASIGLSNLAGYIHEVEELIRETQQAGQTVGPELLLPHVDVIRARVHGEDIVTSSSVGSAAATAVQIRSTSPPTSTAVSASNSAPAVPVPTANPAAPSVFKKTAGPATDGPGEDETVRVKASQLNRLMDMLSELVMLRNQRDTEISELKGIHDELIHSVTRIRMLSHEGEALLASENLADPDLAEEGVSFSHLNEVANDVMESAQRLSACYRPVADGNQAVSQFIRNFRLELVQLRRTPVSGLFRRLHRAISDAARTEGKQVRVELVGENTGIERSLQERIFEPLLHIVRNSVSHGIEGPDERLADGKPPQGIVKLNAHSGPDLLVIEVCDDGRGLDYDAIRRRGIERGLIDSDKSVSHAELARLIFNPGFSTRETANQLSGRGVGMDVVASTLERMRGWVEVESKHGLGSTIRLSLPLPSMIQHAMVFRSGGQLFGLPAQSVRRTGEFDSGHSAVDLNQVLSLRHESTETAVDHSRRSVIELAGGSAAVDGGSGRDLSLLVDRIIGPEEVVVRPMPPMLKSHPLCTGATLSGMGEIVLLLDPRGLVEASRGNLPVTQQAAQPQRKRKQQLPKILVVDDSKSARLRVVRELEKYAVEVVQVDDGQAAVEMLSRDKFATVISDIDMPRMSGLELLESIKGEPRLASTPVIMISSRSVDTAGKHAREIGALAYIQKPLTPERFDEIVRPLEWASS